MTRLLVVTAVDAERDAVLTGLGDRGRALALDRPAPDAPVHVLAGGVGAAFAAAATAIALSRGPYDMVVCAGIGGGLAGRATFGDVAVANAAVAADLGAESPDGFLPLSELGFGRDAFDTDPGLRAALVAGRPGAVIGQVLTVSTVTGTAARAEELAKRHPDAVVEAMEGYGVAVAAYALGVPFGEVRTISNPVGPRDRAAWRIGPALAALTGVGQTLGTLDR